MAEDQEVDQDLVFLDSAAKAVVVASKVHAIAHQVQMKDLVVLNHVDSLLKVVEADLVVEAETVLVDVLQNQEMIEILIL